jgi:hypothetical protein
MKRIVLLFLDELVQLFSSSTKPKVKAEERDGAWINEILGKYMPAHGTNKVQHIWLDRKYWVCSRNEFNEIVNKDLTNFAKYQKDAYDCDNFAFMFKANVAKNWGLNNVGMVIDNSAHHAYNVVVFSDGTAAIFEPQTDQWPKIGKGMYSFKKGVIIL